MMLSSWRAQAVLGRVPAVAAESDYSDSGGGYVPQISGTATQVHGPLAALVNGQWVQIPAFSYYGMNNPGGSPDTGYVDPTYYGQNGQQIVDPFQMAGLPGGTVVYNVNPDGSIGSQYGSVGTGASAPWYDKVLGGIVAGMSGAAIGAGLAGGAGAAGAGVDTAAMNLGAGVGTIGGGTGLGTGALQTAGLGGMTGLGSAGAYTPSLGMASVDSTLFPNAFAGGAAGTGAGAAGAGAGTVTAGGAGGGLTLGNVGAGLGALSALSGLTGGGGGDGLQAASTLGTANPSLGFSASPSQVNAFTSGLGNYGSMLGNASQTTASGISNLGSILSGLGGGSFLNGTDTGSLTNILNGLGTAGGLTDGLGSLGSSGLSGLQNLLQSLGSGAQSVLGTSLGGNATVGSTLPGLLALQYAANQPGLDTSGLQNTINSLQGNNSAYMQSILAPLQQQNATTFGQLEQNLGQRGLLGSSIEADQLSQFNTAANQSLANAGAQAQQGSLALQGNLQSQISQLNLQNQQAKNNLYGTAFNVLGRGLNPISYIGSSV